MIVLFHVWDRKVRQVTPVITTKKRKYHIISGTMLTLPKEISYKKYRIKDLKSGTQCLKVLRIQEMLIIPNQGLNFGNLKVVHTGQVKFTCQK